MNLDETNNFRSLFLFDLTGTESRWPHMFAFRFHANQMSIYSYSRYIVGIAKWGLFKEKFTLVDYIIRQTLQ